MKFLVPIIIAAALLLTAAPAFAGDVTLTNTARSGVWHFTIECFDADGRSQAGARPGILYARTSVRWGSTTCQTFEIRFGTTTGYHEVYQLYAGRHYDYFWNGDHWDLEPA